MGTLSRQLMVCGTLAVALALGGCGPSNSLPGIVPVLNITSPANNSAVNLSVDKKVALSFSSNYTLKSPGSCAGQENCGHVYVLIDSTNCNLPSLPYNALVVASPADADLGKCATPTGQHTISFELRHDDGSTVLNLLNNPVTSKVIITAQ